MSVIFRGALAILGFGLAACSTAPPPPRILPPVPIDSEEARGALLDAVAQLQEAESDGHLSPAECESLTQAFAAVYNPHDPETANGLFDVGVIWERCDQPDKAALAYRETIAAAPKHSGAHNNLGVLQWLAGDHRSAAASFERAVKKAPNSPAPRNNLSSALRERYLKSGSLDDFERAEHALRNALAVDSDNPVSYENLARLYYDRGRTQDRSYLLLADLVITQATQILEQEGEPSAELYNLRGLLLMEEHDPITALRAFRKATEIDTEHAAAHLNIAMIALRFRDYATAEASLLEALADRRHHDNVNALLGLGVAQRGLRHYDDAVQTLARAGDLQEKDPRVLYNLGILYHEHIAPNRSQVADESTGTSSFDDALYLDARRFFERFARAAADHYPKEVADARSRMASIDQFLRDIKELEELQAEQARLEAKARRAQQQEQKRLLGLEERAREAHDDQGLR